jgi:hypothetical protein
MEATAMGRAVLTAEFRHVLPPGKTVCSVGSAVRREGTFSKPFSEPARAAERASQVTRQRPFSKRVPRTDRDTGRSIPGVAAEAAEGR